MLNTITKIAKIASAVVTVVEVAVKAVKAVTNLVRRRKTTTNVADDIPDPKETVKTAYKAAKTVVAAVQKAADTIIKVFVAVETVVSENGMENDTPKQ